MLKRELTQVFGHRLREARLRAGIAQDKLGVQIGLDEGSASARMSRYETGVHEPPFSIAVKLAQALNVPAAFFYCENDDLSKLLLLWNEPNQHERQGVAYLVETTLATRSSDNPTAQ